MALILDVPINSTIFIQFTQTLRYLEDITEHYILRESIFEKNESEEEENEVENFQLINFFITWLRDVSVDSPILPHHKYVSRYPPK